MNAIVRAATLEDIEPMLDMIASVTPGLTTLMLDRERLLERLERSHFAFTRKSESHSGEPYVLVMEDESTGAIIGTSTVYGKTGGYEPFYAYRVVSTTHACGQLAISQQRRTSLHLQRIYDGPTEIGSLFLLPMHRGAGRGRLLSLSRFALIAQRPGQFASRVIAEMRGRCDEQGVSPFWESVMRPFFQVDFPVADALSTISKPFIEELIPQYPLHVELLAPSARDVIGKVHQETEPAVRLLISEGFQATDLVDIFDAGPVLQCDTDKILAVQRCRKIEVTDIVELADAPESIVCSRRDGFRSMLGQVEIADDIPGLRITPKLAHHLKVKRGDHVWYLAPRPDVSSPR